MKRSEILIAVLGFAVLTLLLHSVVGGFVALLAASIAALTLVIIAIWQDHKHGLLKKELQGINELMWRSDTIRRGDSVQKPSVDDIQLSATGSDSFYHDHEQVEEILLAAAKTAKPEMDSLEKGAPEGWS